MFVGRCVGSEHVPVVTHLQKSYWYCVWWRHLLITDQKKALNVSLSYHCNNRLMILYIPVLYTIPCALDSGQFPPLCMGVRGHACPILPVAASACKLIFEPQSYPRQYMRALTTDWTSNAHLWKLPRQSTISWKNCISLRAAQQPSISIFLYITAQAMTMWRYVKMFFEVLCNVANSPLAWILDRLPLWALSVQPWEPSTLHSG